MNNKAFTLVETLMASVLMLILVGVLTLAFFQANSIFYETDILADLQADARLAIDKMAVDLRRTSLSYIDSIIQDSPVAGTDIIDYYLPDDSSPKDGIPDLDNNGDIIWDSVNKIRIDTVTGQLRMINNGVVTVLANNVKKVNFFNQPRDSSLYLNELRVVLELEKTAPNNRTYNTTFTSIINMRN
ncbi:MAG TPA: type II secretion system protein [Candidatus Omnitrophica bacterium]|nr:type II secretion system protein [Candidatus Omnitrophota bacterium]